MTILDDAQKRFIVRRLACFASQVAVIAEFETEYKIKLTADHVSSYDATTKHGEGRMGQELQDLFTETRERYIQDEDAIPLAHRAFRVNWMTDMLLRNEKVQKSVSLQLKVLEQAAKEMGGMYVRHKVEAGGIGNALAELRAVLGVPLTAPEAGPIEAEERERKRQEEREAQEREDAAAEAELTNPENPENGAAADLEQAEQDGSDAAIHQAA